MRRLLSLLVGLHLLGSSQLLLGEGASASAKELVSVCGAGERALGLSMADFQHVLNQMQGQGVSEDGRAKARKAADDFFRSVFFSDAFKERLAQYFDAQFSQSELSDVVAFYKSAAGKKALHVFPALTNQCLSIGEQLGKPKAETFANKLAQIIEQHKKPQTNQ